MYILLWIVTFVIFRPSDVQSEWGFSIYLLSNTFIRINTVAVLNYLLTIVKRI